MANGKVESATFGGGWRRGQCPGAQRHGLSHRKSGAAQSCQARPEEAQELSSGTTKAGRHDQAGRRVEREEEKVGEGLHGVYAHAVHMHMQCSCGGTCNMHMHMHMHMHNIHM